MSRLAIETAGSRATLKQNKLASEIDEFVNGHIGNGQNVVGIEREIVSILTQREIDRKLTLAEESVRNGKTKKVNKEWKANFIDNLKKQILNNQ